MIDVNPERDRETNQKTGQTDRRGFLNFALSAAWLAWVAAVAFPILKYLKPPVETGGGNSLILTDDDKLKIVGKKFTIVRLGSKRIIVFQLGGKLHALAAKCTHEGCTVGYKQDEDILWCACHNGKFNSEGRVISGPPPRPLERFKVTGDLNGTVTIATGEAA